MVIMKVNGSSRSNLRFLYGSVFFFAVLIFTMVLFVYYTMGEASKKVESKMFVYKIFVSGALQERGCDVLFDDSLVYSSRSMFVDTLLKVNRYFVNDTVVENGRRIVREVTCFTPESVLRVVGSDVTDTLAVKVGGNSNIEILFTDGRVEALLSK